MGGLAPKTEVRNFFRLLDCFKVDMQPIGEPAFVSIDEKLSLLYCSPSACCIFKVPNQLRKVNEKAYEPEIIAIGPYHRGKQYLQLMEEHKLRYLQSLLRRKNESSAERYVLAIRSLEPKARKSYAEPISLTPDEMIEMMLLDGCFIIELILKFNMRNLRDKDDSIFRMDWMLHSLQRDLMLFENQLPFFVLRELFDMIEVPNKINRFIDLGFCFFRDLLPGVGCREHVEENSLYGIRHLLGLIYHKWVPSSAGTDPKENEPNETTKWRFIPSATELREAGVKLEKVEGGTLLDIKFQDGVWYGVLQIPPFTIEDRTESFFRNLIAYEQYCLDNQLCYMTDYLTLMNSLIESPKDVAILSHIGIIDNWIGDDEVVSKMFNKIGDAFMVQRDQFYYADILNKANICCQKPWNRRLAKLNQNFLNSPWASISVLAALVLLLLAFRKPFLQSFLAVNCWSYVWELFLACLDVY